MGVGEILGLLGFLYCLHENLIKKNLQPVRTFSGASVSPRAWTFGVGLMRGEQEECRRATLRS